MQGYDFEREGYEFEGDTILREGGGGGTMLKAYDVRKMQL